MPRRALRTEDLPARQRELTSAVTATGYAAFGVVEKGKITVEGGGLPIGIGAVVGLSFAPLAIAMRRAWRSRVPGRAWARPRR